MSDGTGCDGGGDGCGWTSLGGGFGGSCAGGGDTFESMIVFREAVLQINGAAVVETAHEYVIPTKAVARRSPASKR